MPDSGNKVPFGLLLAVLLQAVCFGQQLKVDHVTIAGRDLKHMQAIFASVQFPTQYGGKHTNGLSEMALKSFADGSYLELIAAQKPTGAGAHYWAKFIDGDAGPCAWAVNVDDIAVPEQRLKNIGIPVELSEGGRARPDGVTLAWETLRVGSAPQGTFFPFLIHDVTLRGRRAFPQGKPSDPGIKGVLWVVIAVRDLPSAIEQYRKAFQLGEPAFQNDPLLGARLAAFPDSPVILAGALSAESWLGRRLAQFGDAPCAFVIASNGQGRFVTRGASNWFNYSFDWLDPEKLGGMRIGIGGGK
ncbi:MAG: VOC family protein [Bryobacteraceae bacterium]